VEGGIPNVELGLRDSSFNGSVTWTRDSYLIQFHFHFYFSLSILLGKSSVRLQNDITDN
jgi:hypothetical protein